MTAEEDQDQAPARNRTRLRPSQVVKFQHEDRILGGNFEDVGVVLAVNGDQVQIRPLARHDVQVDAANVTPLSADDVSGG